MSLMSLTRSAVAAVCDNRLGRYWVRRHMFQTVNIVYYHWVGGCTPHYAEFHRDCDLKRFRKDLQFLQSHFEIVPLEALVHEDARSSTPEKPRMAITFDDGFDLDRNEVLEILDEFNVRLTTLVITQCLDNRHLMWRNKLSVIRARVPADVCVREYNSLMAAVGYPGISAVNQLMPASFQWEMSRKDELAGALWDRCGLQPVEEYLAEHRPYFTRAGLRKWISAGHGIGLHTATHPRCSRLTPDEVRTEIINPAHELKREFGLNQLAFSYPFGERLPRDLEEQAIREARLSCALGIRGFAGARTAPSRLERQGVESTGVNWGIMAGAALRGFRQGCRI